MYICDNEIMKTARPGKHIPPVELIAYPHDRELCPVSIAEYYLQRKENKRRIHQVMKFISYVYSNQPVTTSTLSTMVQRDS